MAPELREATAHIQCCMREYEEQRKNGRFFLHEHPDSATSWQLKEVVVMSMSGGVEIEHVDMCGDGKGLVRKRTKVMSNAPEVLKRIARQCSNGPGKQDTDHKHVQLIGGKAKRAQIYPRAFCKAVCEGVGAQKRLHSMGLIARPLMSIEKMDQAVSAIGVDKDSDEEPSRALHEYDVDDGFQAYDDQSGDPSTRTRFAKPDNQKLSISNPWAYMKRLTCRYAGRRQVKSLSLADG